MRLSVCSAIDTLICESSRNESIAEARVWTGSSAVIASWPCSLKWVRTNGKKTVRSVASPG